MQSEMPAPQRDTTRSDQPDSVLAKIMDTGEFSDLTFVCDGEKFKVHKAIVCTQSEPLKAAVQGGFLESHTGTISMDSFHVQTVKHFVQFMYKGDYDSDDPPDDDRYPPSTSFYPNGTPKHMIDPRYAPQWTDGLPAEGAAP
ncbi:speckle-type POZ protein-like protein [Aspergillus terreus]|uniref:Speckle-type POZ protein-like protein n=1 Tax=Aspergillus terreus TaxID=33178 RepID=A0A5M3YNQ7_ASPTE|nr:hypothetical protein ATETN484_0001082800 [Aspergillus terreus]GFF12683.1 speckle-type POZ protein-like protein [Aspergillus terreus]